MTELAGNRPDKNQVTRLEDNPGKQRCGVRGPARLEVVRDYRSHQDAMLQALRIVLGLPKKPMILDIPERELAITLEQSVHVPNRTDHRPGDIR
jgi:hypothetical protein